VQLITIGIEGMQPLFEIKLKIISRYIKVNLKERDIKVKKTFHSPIARKMIGPVKM
jgi:hypothetical protein